jgi:hypothetical protein
MPAASIAIIETTNANKDSESDSRSFIATGESIFGASLSR